MIYTAEAHGRYMGAKTLWAGNAWRHLTSCFLNYFTVPSDCHPCWNLLFRRYLVGVDDLNWVDKWRYLYSEELEKQKI